MAFWKIENTDPSYWIKYQTIEAEESPAEGAVKVADTFEEMYEISTELVILCPAHGPQPVMLMDYSSAMTCKECVKSNGDRHVIIHVCDLPKGLQIRNTSWDSLVEGLTDGITIEELTAEHEARVKRKTAYRQQVLDYSTRKK